MSSGVVITLIICVTLVVMQVITAMLGGGDE